MKRLALALAGVWFAATALHVRAQLAIVGETVWTLAGEPLTNGVILIRDRKIEAVGPAMTVKIPDGWRVLRAKVVTPGLIDAHSTVGFSGILNQPQDQEQLEKSAPIQPELRAIDGYNPRDPLVEWVRNLGVTTLHTGHAPGAAIAGQTILVKTVGDTVDAALISPLAMLAATVGQGATSGAADKAPGTRSKVIALLRAEFVKAQEYLQKRAKTDEDKRPARDLHLETLALALAGKVPLLVTAHRHQDILAALRLAEEFKLKLVLDGVADAHLVLDPIRRSGFPVIVHPTMTRAAGEAENLTLEMAAKLKAAGIPFALQSGFEGYVPKTRVVLFEAAVAAANGLGFRDALAAITVDAAKLLGIADRVGSLEAGKDADVALYDGDPFEYTSHCVGVVVNGAPVSTEPH